MKEIKYSIDARKELLSGVEMIAKAVKTTLGPSGRNVLIRNKGENRPFSTKDGVTVAAQVSSLNPIEQVAIESLQDIANITDEGAGDGTTTATVLAEAILKNGLKNIADHNLFDVKRGIEEASRLVVEILDKNAIDIKSDLGKLREVAMISSNHDPEIADVVYDAFEIAGKQGIVNIKRSKSYETYVKAIKGMTLPVGYISQFYANTSEETCVLEKPWVYITNKKITAVSPNLDYLLGQCAEKGEAILIMCAGMDPLVADMFIRNAQQGALKVCVTKNPGFGNEQEDLLRDLGTVLGAKPFIENEGLDFDDIAQDDLLSYIPRSKEVTVTKNVTSFMEVYVDVSREFAKSKLIKNDDQDIDVLTEDRITKEVEKSKLEKEEILARIETQKEARAEKLRGEVENTTTQFEKSQLQTRISRLADGIAFINIGSRSNTEFLEKQARVQDALYAVKSAHQEGIIPGGGAALYTIARQMKIGSISDNPSILYGAEVLRASLETPMLQIIENVGVTLSRAELEYIGERFKCGYNANTRLVEDDLIAIGIIDPKKVTRVALESAVSIAAMVLTTECVIVDKEVYEKENRQF